MKKGKQLVRFDWAMKKLLRNKANFGILEGFLSELLSEDIKIHRILESEGNKEEKNDKHNRVDILVEDSKGELIIVEVQNSKEYDYFHRILYGTSKAIAEYIDAGEAYENVKKVISVTIAYFDLGQGKDYVYHGKTEFKGIHKGDVLNLAKPQVDIYDIEEVHEIYPEYWLIKVDKFNNVIQDKLDEWIYFLKNGAVQDDFSAKGLPEAKKKLDEMLLNDDEKAAYKYYLKRLRDIASEQRTKIYDAQFEAKEAEERRKLEQENQKLQQKGQELEQKGQELEQKKQELEAKNQELRQKLEQAVVGMDEAGMPIPQITQLLDVSEARVKEILAKHKKA